MHIACVEATVDLTCEKSGFTVRLWVDNTVRQMTDDQVAEILFAARAIVDRAPTAVGPLDLIAGTLDRLDVGAHITAVQVIRPPISEGHLKGVRMGSVIYTQWP